MKEVALVDQIYIRLETQPDGHTLHGDPEGVAFTKVILVRGNNYYSEELVVPVLCWARLTEKMLLQNWTLRQQSE